MKNKFSDKPSEVIDMALADLIAIEKMDGYRIDMAHWHSPDTLYGKPVCYVCLAGAVIAQETEAQPTEKLTPDLLKGLTSSDIKKLDALDALRCGWLSVFLEDGFPDLPFKPEYTEILEKYEGSPTISSWPNLKRWLQVDYVRYDTNDPEKFKDYLRIVANVLEDLGV